MSPEELIDNESHCDEWGDQVASCDTALEAVRLAREESKPEIKVLVNMIIKKDERIKVLEDTMVEIERLLKMITNEI